MTQLRVRISHSIHPALDMSRYVCNLNYGDHPYTLFVLSDSLSRMQVENNVCINSGGGWSSAQRPDEPKGVHIQHFRESGAVFNFSIRNNLFCAPSRHLPTCVYSRTTKAWQVTYLMDIIVCLLACMSFTVTMLRNAYACMDLLVYSSCWNKQTRACLTSLAGACSSHTVPPSQEQTKTRSLARPAAGVTPLPRTTTFGPSLHNHARSHDIVNCY